MLFVATIPSSHGGSAAGSAVAWTRPDDLAGAGQPQPARVDRVHVLLPRVVRPDLDVVERAEVRGEERADRAAADHRDPHARLPRLDEPVHRRVQRHRHVVLRRLPDERAGDEVDLGRPAGADVLEHRGHVGVVALGGERLAPADRRRTFISHGSSWSSTPGGGGNRLALVHQVADEAGRGRCRRRRRRTRSRAGRSVSAATVFTVALKISFDHCAGRRSGKARACRPGRDEQRLDLLRLLVRGACRRRGRARSRCRARTRRARPRAGPRS